MKKHGLVILGCVLAVITGAVHADEATSCVRIVQLASGDSALSGGGTVIANDCGVTVEVAWCNASTECSQGRGNQWSISAGMSWPISNGSYYYAACTGKNTISANFTGSGIQYSCSD